MRAAVGCVHGVDTTLLYVAGFEGMEEPPTVMLLMGNFQSTACAADAAAMKENFSALAATLLRFPRLLVRAMH